MSYLERDPLLTVAACRATLLAAKRRDYAADFAGHEWPERTETVTGMSGCDERILSAADFNERQREFHGGAKSAASASYRMARLRAYRRCSRLAQAEMLAMAQRCVNAVERLPRKAA